MINDETECKILDMLDSGIPVSAIARKTGVSRFTVYRVKHSPRDCIATRFRGHNKDLQGTLREQIIWSVDQNQIPALASVALDVVELNALAIIEHPLLHLLAIKAEKALKGENHD